MTIKPSILLTDERPALARAQEIEALRELVSRRGKGEFVSADEISGLAIAPGPVVRFAGLAGLCRLSRRPFPR